MSIEHIIEPLKYFTLDFNPSASILEERSALTRPEDQALYVLGLKKGNTHEYHEAVKALSDFSTEGYTEPIEEENKQYLINYQSYPFQNPTIYSMVMWQAGRQSSEIRFSLGQGFLVVEKLVNYSNRGGDISIQLLTQFSRVGENLGVKTIHFAPNSIEQKTS